MRGRSGFASILLALIVGGALVYGVVILTNPWAMHIGGRLTPFLTWSGSGTLHTKAGDYPLYVSLYPSSHFSKLHLEGLRPTGGVQGSGWLCSSRGVMQRLELSGTIYGGWSSTEGSLMAFRLLEYQTIHTGERRGYFDLTGRWQGPRLVMDDHGHPASPFRSGMRIEHAAVSLDWGSYSDFKAGCGK